MMNKTTWLFLGIMLVLVGLAVIFIHKPKVIPVYQPEIKATNFTKSTIINHPYFTLTPGATFHYQTKKADGPELNDVKVLKEIEVIMGIPTVTVHDQVFSKGELTEDTYDWYAEDNDGNVWYFGEATAEYENGQVKSREGSWQAGKNGAEPGIMMQANPQVGQSYYQEYLKGEAEDKADIVSLNESVNVPAGTFTHCLKTKDYTLLDPKTEEYKYYCKEIGNVTLEIDQKNNERVELLKID